MTQIKQIANPMWLADTFVFREQPQTVGITEEPCDDCYDIHYGSVLITDKALLTEILNKTK